MEKLTGKELEELIANRKAAMELAKEAAIKGDGICGGLFALIHDAESCGLGFVADTMQDYDDEDDEVRPY